MFQRIPVVTKNIIIINVIVWLACFVSEPLRLSLTGYSFLSENFRPWQVITHMFMHANYAGGGPAIGHIFFNMFAVFMFGSALEYAMGPKRYLNYYLLCGLGAFLLHQIVSYFEIRGLEQMMTAESIDLVYREGGAALREGKNFIDDQLARLNAGINTGLVGASGCVFGLLVGYGMLFPNRELIMLFFPVPIKAKYFVMIYGGIELLLAFQNSPADNVAHFAHIGGLICGFIIIRIWRSQGKL